MSSRYEKNVAAQPALLTGVLKAPRPAWMKPPKGRRCFLVGVGTNFHAANVAAWEWRRAGLDARALHSFDFATLPPVLRRGDLGVFLSHRGTKSYTVKAEALARKAGVETVVFTGAGSPWKPTPRRLETGPMEDTGAFTQSLTTALAWLLRWGGRPAALAPFKRASALLAAGPAFPAVKPGTDLVLIGDGPREWVAHETALKLMEAAYVPARAFGLEQFLHGPRVSVGEGSVAVCFADPKEKRWETARRYLATIEVPFTEVSSADWLTQILWGQRFTAEVCRARGIDPDLLRNDVERYARARKELSL